MIKAVIFDMDGVIVDSEKIHVKHAKEIFKYLNIEVSETDHAAMTGRSSKNMWQFLKAKHQFRESVEEVLALERAKYYAHVEQYGYKLMPGIVQLIHTIHSAGLAKAVASSSGMHNINKVMAYCNLETYFPVRVSGADFPKSKPHPALFLKAAELMQVDTNECVVIEDATNGLKAAKSAGMKCIAFRGPNVAFAQDHSLADKIITNFTYTTVQELLYF